jgi:excisionase family DNA binding protein
MVTPTSADRRCGELRPDLSPKDLARELGISETSAKRLLRAKSITSYRCGKLWRTTRAHLNAFRDRGGSVPAIPPPVRGGSSLSAV